MKRSGEFWKPSLGKRAAFYLVGDLVLVPLSVFLAYWLMFEGHLPGEFLTGAYALSGVALLVVIAANSLTGFYRMKWGAFGLRDTLYGLAVMTAAAGLMWLLSLTRLVHFPGSILLLWLAASFLFFLLFRGGKVITRCILSRASRLRRPACILVIPSDNRHAFIEFLSGVSWLPYRIAGIIDPNPRNKGSTVQGITVLGTLADIAEAIRKTRARCVVVVETTPAQFQMADLWRDLKGLDIEVRVVSSGGTGNIRRIAASDLIKREPVRVEIDSISSFIEGKTVMVTGAGGSIGSALARRLAEFDPGAIVLFERDETSLFRIEEELTGRASRVIPFLGDITSEPDLEEAFTRWEPQVVFHAAAYKHVPMMEHYPQKAILNNVWGTYLVATRASAHEARVFVNISTDKAVCPECVMGATKRVAEMVVSSLGGNGTRMVSVRFGNVLGSRGSVLELFEKRIAERKPIFVTHRDMERYFMLMDEAVLLVLEAAANPEGGLYVLNMGESVNIHGMAESLIRMAGLVPGKDVKIIVTGRRPGEKLTEELFWPHEKAIPVMDGRFFRIKGDSTLPPEDFFARVHDLVELAGENRMDDLRPALFELAWAEAHKEVKWLPA